jgi:hypothetical protein
VARAATLWINTVRCDFVDIFCSCPHASNHFSMVHNISLERNLHPPRKERNDAHTDEEHGHVPLAWIFQRPWTGLYMVDSGRVLFDTTSPADSAVGIGFRVMAARAILFTWPHP